MQISFLVNHITDGWEPSDKRLGGTERGIMEWAEELNRRGHDINIFYNGRDGLNMTSRYEATYWPREDYQGQGDVTINVKSPEIAPLNPTIFYTNNTDADQLDLSKYLAVIQISEWAKVNIPVNNPSVFICPHGYDEAKIYPSRKVNKQCLYASSPDRGLDTLLRAWPTVLQAHPDATLKVTYGAKEYDLPNVEFLDATEDEMAQLYRESDIWAYPCNGGELQCITGLKAQAAGCVPVVVPTMALSETVKNGYFSTSQGFTASLIHALTENREPMRDKMAKEHYLTIKESTDILLEIINGVVN